MNTQAPTKPTLCPRPATPVSANNSQMAIRARIDAKFQARLEWLETHKPRPIGQNSRLRTAPPTAVRPASNKAIKSITPKATQAPMTNCLHDWQESVTGSVTFRGGEYTDTIETILTCVLCGAVKEEERVPFVDGPAPF